MLLSIINIIAPVFLVIGFGYLIVRRGIMTDDLIDGLMKFAVQIAIPCLLFRATSSMDLGSSYDWRLMTAFYVGATISFTLATLLAWKVFRRHPGESVAVGFGALFSNLVLLGLPISERAWGTENLSPAFAVVSVHAPFCYLLGITAMELLRSDGRSLPETTQVVVKAMFRNSMMIGIGLGFMVNLSGLALPQIVTSAVDLLSRAALPAALFGLGGVLTRYTIKHSLSEAAMVTFMSLFVHPTITWLLCQLFAVESSLTRIVVLMAAMAPGANSYLFSAMYQRGQGTAASSVLLGTAISIFSISVWLWLLS